MTDALAVSGKLNGVQVYVTQKHPLAVASIAVPVV